MGEVGGEEDIEGQGAEPQGGTRLGQDEYVPAEGVDHLVQVRRGRRHSDSEIQDHGPDPHPGHEDRLDRQGCG
eukprot:12734810-Heterocapsa_arctica.AAC.1